MTVHVLHAGDGYTYLTRQVATQDTPRDPGQTLTDYYVQQGNPPGQWVGGGLEKLGVAGDVTEAQMKALFGEGLHPDAEKLTAAAIAAGASPEEALKAVRLGRKFPEFKAGADDFHDAVQEAYATFHAERDRLPEVGVERDLIRWNVAGEMYAAEHDGKAPTDAQRARYLATRGMADRQPVAGYDLVFTPVKSVSVLWGLGDEYTRQQITEAHQAAWCEALAWIEAEGAFTRVGQGGVAQIDTHGLTAAAFDHLDSRTGDPNLHTHVAVSNKVMGVDGKWRSIDGRVLHALGVAASERYNTNIEAELHDRLGVEFVEETRGAGKQGVREIDGIEKSVRDAFSTRRAAIEDVYERLLREYREQHGREAPRAMQFRLAQQATLETRGAKEGIVSLRERLGQWRDTAALTLGSTDAIDRMTRAAVHRAPAAREVVPVDELVRQAMRNLAERRSTWTRFHVEAEANRVAREHAVAHGLDVHDLADVIAAGVTTASVDLTPPDLNEAPEVMRRADGASIYTIHGTDRYSSLDVLEAEDRLVRAAQTDGGLVGDPAALEQAISATRLNAGQRAMVVQFARGGHVLETGIGPAGAGKTTAMKAYADAVQRAGGRVLGLGPSAAAAAVLGAELGTHADTLHKLLDAHRRAEAADAEITGELRVDERTVLLVDEAGMAGTLDLDEVLALAQRHGATVRFLGDPAQLSAVSAGGALRLIDQQAGTAHLDEVHRFADQAQAAASLLLREGDHRGLAYYVENRRTVGGTRDDMLDDVYAAWTADRAAGRTAIMVAASNADVDSLSARARLDLVTDGKVEADGVELHNGTRAGAGDVIVTRQNDRRLRGRKSTDFVKNGDLWNVVERGRHGHLRVQHVVTGVRVTLPAAYVAEHVELGYAATIHRVQGMTVDTSHTLVEPSTTREQLYTAVTRGRDANRLYVVVDEVLDVDVHEQPTPEQAVIQVLRGVVEHEGAEISAAETIEAEYDQAASLARLVPAYEDAYARLLDPGRAERFEQVVRATVPDLADQLLADDAWPALAHRLALHEAAGADVAEVLDAAAGRRDFDDARSLAQVLHYRVGVPDLQDLDTRGLPSWITPAPDVVIPQSYVDPTLPADVDPGVYARVVEVNEAAWAWWTSQRETESWASDYMTGRGISDAEYGVAPAGWTGLVDALTDAGYSREDMLAAGVATETRKGSVVDRFRDRVVFPIRDEAGDVVAVTARLNPAVDDPKAPKYLNTPETIAYRKREILFGLDPVARARLADGARPALVEGPTDVAAMRQAVPDVVPVAACGTGVTDQHLEALRRASGRDLSDLVVALDSDAAGCKAAARVWTMLTPTEAAAARGVVLPDGADPGQMVQDHRGAELADRVDSAAPLTHIALDRVVEAHDLDTIEGRVYALREAATTAGEHLGRAGMPGVHAYLADRLADRLDADTITDEVMTATLDAPETPVPVEVPASETDPEVAAWLSRQADLMSQRLDRLVDDVAAIAPAWAREHLTAPPADGPDRDQWDAAVRQIVAYRDRYGITGAEVLGGAEGVRGEQAAAYGAARTALGTVEARDVDAPGWGQPGAEQPAQVGVSSRLDSLLEGARRRQEQRTTERRIDEMLADIRRRNQPGADDAPEAGGPTAGGPQI
ncbi:MobF family relaxase [Luteimicrobium sp. DT211]|uniref:MobF family relaxase n=1 Tax=Luteimicrobium sp. DT211 TaxID=3393412 RepID=UPI003CFBBFEF